MSKKLILVLGVIVFLFGARFAFASLSINEIMYAPSNGSDYEWVEIFNSGNSSIDLDNYRFFHGETNSGPLTLKQGSDTILQPSEYALVAKSMSSYSWLNFSGMILSASTVSLPDSGDNTYIAISGPDKVILDYVKYDTSLGGNKESGNSLQSISGSWKGATPTPGAQNQYTATTSTGSGGLALNNSVSSTSTSVPVETKSKTTEETKIKTQIIAKALGFVGSALSFSAKTYGLEGEQLYSGKYFWNFGDGDSKEIRLPDSSPLMHSYFYPGEYVVSLDYYQNYYGDIPDASSQIIIKIVSADIIISNVGDEKDFFIELTNNTDYNADISNYFLVSDKRSFNFPRNTIFFSKKKMIIAPQISGFSFEDKNSLKLVNSKREVISDYSSNQLAKNTARESSISVQISKINSNKNNLAKAGVEAVDLTASAINSDASDQDSSSSYKFPFIPIISTVFIGTCACAVYFIRRKKTTGEYGSDFEILDE